MITECKNRNRTWKVPSRVAWLMKLLREKAVGGSIDGGNEGGKREQLNTTEEKNGRKTRKRKQEVDLDNSIKD